MERGRKRSEAKTPLQEAAQPPEGRTKGKTSGGDNLEVSERPPVKITGGHFSPLPTDVTTQEGATLLTNVCSLLTVVWHSARETVVPDCRGGSV
jgi:hypothetical protein